MSLPLRSPCHCRALGQPLILSIVAASAILTLLVPAAPSLAKQVQAISSKSTPQNGTPASLAAAQQQHQVLPSQAPSLQQVASPTQSSGAGQSNSPASSQTDLQQQQQPQPARPAALVPNGAQLFQSPAALAAAAAAAAAALASNQLQVQSSSPFVQQQQQQQQQANQAQQQAASIATNLISPSQLANSLVSARVDTNELLKQAVQQSQLQQSQQQVSSAGLNQATNYNIEQECVTSGGFISFELITGYVLSAPADSMIMQPGTLQLTDCLNLCRQNSSCLAINFETGLCVLLQESADKNPQALQKSQFPVFTIYAHKICVQGDRANRCHKSWSFERVIGWVLNNLEKKTLMTKTRLECLLACYNEQAFQCRSFNYDSASGACSLSDMDRHSLPNASLRRRHYVESTVDTIDYGENNCIQEARGICDFKPVQNRILKTVDSIYQDIKTEPECRKRCLQAPYRCHSYDLGDSSNPVCRTSHLDRNSLQQIQEPYLDIQGAISYELDSCYNVTVLCKSREMVARVKTNKIFNGKIYAKNAPLSCVNDVTNSMDFELPMAFNDACAIGRSGVNGMFSNEIVLQHNDMIVTNSDMGLNIKCQYDLRNQTVYNNINLDDFMSGREPIDIASQSAVVRSPNISMQILRQDGNHITQAQVGDSLLLRFQITDERSPFEIFVRDLYAMDGVGGAEIMLIDGEGCPTDPTIMAAMTNAKGNGQLLEAQFDAFKFPTSETVAFRGLVTPCIPHCEPVHCQNRVYDGTVYETESYGKRRRRKRSALAGAGANQAAPGGAKSGAAPEEVVVRNSIEIKDKFFLDEEANSMDQDGSSGVARLKMSAYETIGADGSDQVGQRLSSLFGRIGQGYLRAGGLMFFFGVLLLAQSAMFLGWMFVSRKRAAAAANKLARSHLAQLDSRHHHHHQQHQQQLNDHQHHQAGGNRYHV